jgi:hypothetical protein
MAPAPATSVPRVTIIVFSSSKAAAAENKEQDRCLRAHARKSTVFLASPCVPIIASPPPFIIDLHHDRSADKETQHTAKNV